MFTDTHCHVLSDKFYDPMYVIDNLERDNIRRIIINGFNIKSNCEVMDLIIIMFMEHLEFIQITYLILMMMRRTLLIKILKIKR